MTPRAKRVEITKVFYPSEHLTIHEDAKLDYIGDDWKREEALLNANTHITLLIKELEDLVKQVDGTSGDYAIGFIEDKIEFYKKVLMETNHELKGG